jgi:hypothetical protein
MWSMPPSAPACRIQGAGASADLAFFLVSALASFPAGGLVEGPGAGKGMTVRSGAAPVVEGPPDAPLATGGAL